MSIKTVLQTDTGKFILVISILMICFVCVIFKIFCIGGTRDVRQRSKIVPVEKKEETIIELTINPYNFVKVIETSLHNIHENLNEKEIAYIEI